MTKEKLCFLFCYFLYLMGGAVAQEVRAVVSPQEGCWFNPQQSVEVSLSKTPDPVHCLLSHLVSVPSRPSPAAVSPGERRLPAATECMSLM